MLHRLSRLFLACVLLVAPFRLGASYLFVFDGKSPAATVFDTQQLRRVASPMVGLQATQAFGVADPSDVTRFAKFYVVAEGSVTILNADFSVRGNVFLAEKVARGSHAAALAPNGRRLLIAAEKSVYVIDTVTDSILASLDPGFAPTDIVALPGSARAYVISTQSRFVRVIDVTAGALLDSVAELPTIPSALAASPDGSKIFAASPGALYDLAGAPEDFFQSLSALEQLRRSHGFDFALSTGEASGSQSLVKNEAPDFLRNQKLSIDRLVLTNSEQFFVRVGADFMRARFDPTSPFLGLTDPSNGKSLAANDVSAIAASPEGSSVFIATTDRLIKSDSGCTVQEQSVALEGAPAAMALVASPVEQQNCTLPKTGDGLVIVENTSFTLGVGNANTPSGGVLAKVTTSPANVVSCDDFLINGQTTFLCKTHDVAGTTKVTLTLTSFLGCAKYDLTVVPSGASVDGLTKLYGDEVSVVKNSSFQLLIESRSGGTPQPGLELDIVATPGSPTVACPASVTTGSNGVASINCNAGAVATNTTVQIKVTDSTNSTRTVTFNLTVLASGNPNTGLTKVSSDPLTVASNTEFKLSVQALSGTSPQPNLVLTASPDNTLLTCGTQATTNADGIAEIPCASGNATANTQVSVLVGDGTRSVVFFVNIVPSGSLVDGLSKVSGDNQFVPLQSAFPLPLTVRAVNANGPQTGIRLNVSSASPRLFCSSSVLTDANGLGSINCSAMPVVAANFVTINVSDTSTPPRTLAEPFHATLLPTPPGNASDIVVLSSDTVTGAVGSTVAEGIKVRAINTLSEPVIGAAVFFHSAAGITFNPPAAVTNGIGEATTNVIFGCPTRATGTINIGLNVDGTTRTVNYNAQRGPLVSLKKTQGDNQSGGAQQTLTQALTVVAGDACGTGLQNQTITWAVDPPEAATLLNTVATTDQQGRSSTRVRLGNLSGPFTITASNAGFQAVFSANVTVVPVGIQTASGNNQTVALGQTTSQPLVAKVISDDDIGVAGINVSFNVISGAGTVSPGNVLTDGQGNASANVLTGNVLGPIVVEASAILGNQTRTTQFTINTSGRSPSLTLLGFVNGASFVQGWVPGSTGTIFGVGLMEGVDGVVSSSTFPFPLELAGVSVTINGVKAPILALANVNGQEQINIQVPFNIPSPGTTSVVLNNNGSSTTITGVQILSVQPGIFEVSVEGGRFAAALHADYSLVTPSNPAHPGETIQLFLTGLGATDPPVGTNVAGPSPAATTVASPVVGIDNVGMQVAGNTAFYAPQLVTVYQINFVVGPDVQSGNRDLNVALGGATSPSVKLPVQR